MTAAATQPARTAGAAPPPALELARASGSFVVTSEGRELVDLVNGFGAVFLGHGHPHVLERLKAQADRLWLCGRTPTDVLAEAERLLGTMLPAGLRSAGLYSTGMEAAEFAMRIAAVNTGRDRFVGFSRSMHGKSAMTAALCWENAPLPSERLHRLP